MDNNNDITLGMFPSFGVTEEEKKAQDERMKVKWEFARQIENDARMIERELFRRMTADGGLEDFENYELVSCTEALRNLTAAVSQADAFASIPTYYIPGWGRCAAE